MRFGANLVTLSCCSFRLFLRVIVWFLILVDCFFFGFFEFLKWCGILVFFSFGYFVVNRHCRDLFFFFCIFFFLISDGFVLWGKVVSDVLFRFGVFLILVIREPFVAVFPRATDHLLDCDPSVRVSSRDKLLIDPASAVKSYRWVGPDEPDDKVT